MGAAVVWALSRCMRIYINEPTKCLKIRDFRFWHRSKLSITSTSSEKRQRPQPVSSAHSRKSGKGKRPTIWLRRFNWRIAKTKPLYAWICCAFYGGGWCSTAGREARPALIRLARRSRDKSDQRASHLLPRAEEGTFSEVQEQTHFVLGFAGFFWRLVVLDHRSRGATGSHPSGTPVARQERPARQPPSPANGRRDGLGRGEC
jgi:hypothetical protein